MIKQKNTGTVLELLLNGQCIAELPNGDKIRCYLSGKMRIHHIKIEIGDSIEIETDDYGDIGRVVRRK